MCGSGHPSALHWPAATALDSIELLSVTGLNQQRVTNHSTVYETAISYFLMETEIAYPIQYVFYINHVNIVACVFTPEVQHVRNCPIDCASIYYNGVRRSGIYTVVPSLGAMPVEVYCDMDTDGKKPHSTCSNDYPGLINKDRRSWSANDLDDLE